MATAGTRHSQLVRWFIMAPFFPPESGPIAIYGLTTTCTLNTGDAKSLVLCVRLQFEWVPGHRFRQNPTEGSESFFASTKTNLNVSGGWSKQGNHYPIPGKMCGR